MTFINDPSEKIADSVANSAALLGISVSQFRRLYIFTGLVTPVDLGGRAESILRSQLVAAVNQRAAEQIADPSKKTARSGGAVLKREGRIGNKYGRLGKPPVAKAVRK